MYHIDSMNANYKIILTKEPNIDLSSIIKDCSVGEFVQIGANNNIKESIIDDYSYTSENCQIIYSNIKKFVNIASYVRLNPGQHPMQNVTQHHMQYRREMFGFGEDDLDFFDWRREKKVEIEHDAWIGHNVTIMGGVKIGIGAVIGSGAIVTKDIPDFAIAVGNPARVLKYRFDEKTIDSLKNIAWWNWDYKQLKLAMDDFKDSKFFIEKYNK